MSSEQAEAPLFEAVITPYRSLSRRGTHIVIGLLLSLSLASTTLFFWLGAWPVAGFNGAEIVLAVLLLRVHGRFMRETELVILTERKLAVIRTDRHGRRRERRLEPAWLRVVLEERQGRIPALYLAASGLREEIAARLGENEKRDLAAALAAALDRRRNPVFDNPQLREASIVV